MSRISLIFVAVGAVLAAAGGCSERTVKVGGVCEYQWFPGPAGKEPPPSEPCPELVVRATRLTDGKVFEAATDRAGRFELRLPPSRYQFSVVGCPEKHPGARPNPPVKVDVRGTPADDVRLRFSETGW